jgi:hypothetical protein
MLEKGLNPSDFSIEKYLTIIPAFRGVPQNIYEYQITFHNHSYAVRRVNDMDFLAYFSTLCLSEEHDDTEEPHMSSRSFFSKLIGWLEADAFASPEKSD